MFGADARALARHNFAERRKIALQSLGIFIIDLVLIDLAKMALSDSLLLHTQYYNFDPCGRSCGLVNE